MHPDEPIRPCSARRAPEASPEASVSSAWSSGETAPGDAVARSNASVNRPPRTAISMRSAASARVRSGSSGMSTIAALPVSWTLPLTRRAARAIAERVEERLELAGTAAARGELAIGEQDVGGALAVTGGEPVPHDLAHARDLIHRAERTVIAGLPREARAAVRDAAVLATSSAAPADSRARASGSSCASTSTRTTSWSTTRPSPTASTSWRASRLVSAASVSTPGDSALTAAGATGWRRIASASIAARAGASSAEISHAFAPNRARAYSRRSASGTPRVRANAASQPSASPNVSSRWFQRMRRAVDVEALELDLGDRSRRPRRRADRGRRRRCGRARSARAAAARAGWSPRRCAGAGCRRSRARAPAARASARASRARSAARVRRASGARWRDRPGWHSMIVHGTPSVGASSVSSRVFPEPSAPCSETSGTTARFCLRSASSSWRPTNGTGPMGVMGFVIFEVRRRIGMADDMSARCAPRSHGPRFERK